MAGNFGYGHAKTALLDLILENYKEAREKYNYYINDKSLLEKELQTGANKARKIASQTLRNVREKLGFIN